MCFTQVKVLGSYSSRSQTDPGEKKQLCAWKTWRTAVFIHTNDFANQNGRINLLLGGLSPLAPPVPPLMLYKDKKPIFSESACIHQQSKHTMVYR